MEIIQNLSVHFQNLFAWQKMKFAKKCYKISGNRCLHEDFVPVKKFSE